MEKQRQITLTKYSDGDCANCGADKGLHMSGTLQCPLNGREETRFNKETNKWYPQQWQDSFFENVEWYQSQQLKTESELRQSIIDKQRITLSEHYNEIQFLKEENERLKEKHRLIENCIIGGIAVSNLVDERDSFKQLNSELVEVAKTMIRFKDYLSDLLVEKYFEDVQKLISKAKAQTI